MVSAIRGLTGNFDIVTGLNATRVGADAVSEEGVGKCLYILGPVIRLRHGALPRKGRRRTAWGRWF